MEVKLFSEINPLYASGRGNPNTCRIRLRLSDRIDPAALRHAVDAVMKRYPYFCVELKKKDGQYVFLANRRPFVITEAPKYAALNAEASNYHLISFSYADDWIFMDMSHALTDGTGAFELIRTLLYCYCSERYQVELRRDGVRLPGDVIPAEEWEDPAIPVPVPSEGEGGEIPSALNLTDEAKRPGEAVKTVYAVTVPEAEFMRFNQENDGSPATMTSLLLSRAIADAFPDDERPIRISLCVNLRKALRKPLAHQSLVGGAWLEYKRIMRDWPLDRQATAYRGMVFAQTQDEKVLESLGGINRNAWALLAMDSDRERMEAAARTSDFLKRVLTATVSYVGKANFGEAERYVCEFHAWANAMNEALLVEVSAVNREISLDIIQNFSGPAVADAFVRQLEENGIRYERREPVRLELPEICLPWL